MSNRDNPQTEKFDPGVYHEGSRQNGFGKPLHPLQLFSWIIFGLNFLCFYLLNMVSISSLRPAQFVLGVLYLVLTITVVLLAARATKCDPTDEVVYRERQSVLDGVRFDNRGLEYFCASCDTHV